MTTDDSIQPGHSRVQPRSVALAIVLILGANVLALYGPKLAQRTYTLLELAFSGCILIITIPSSFVFAQRLKAAVESGSPVHKHLRRLRISLAEIAIGVFSLIKPAAQLLARV